MSLCAKARGSAPSLVWRVKLGEDGDPVYFLDGKDVSRSTAPSDLYLPVFPPEVGSPRTSMVRDAEEDHPVVTGPHGCRLAVSR